MNIRLTFSLLCSLAIATASVSTGHAEIQLRIDPSVASVISGAEVTVALILVDVNGAVGADGGLFGGGGRLLLADSSSATATITDISQITPNSGFSLATTIYPFGEPFPSPAPLGFSQLGGFLGASDFSTAVQPVGNEISLAQFVVTITGSPGDSIEIHPATLGGTLIGNLGFNSGVNFDATLVSINVATITIVPEPNGVWLAFLTASLVVARRKARG